MLGGALDDRSAAGSLGMPWMTSSNPGIERMAQEVSS